MFATGSGSAAAPDTLQSDMSLVLVGITDCEDPRLSSVKSAKNNLIAWLVQAVRVGVQPERVALLSQPAITLGDVCDAMLQWDLPRSLKIRVLSTFGNIAYSARANMMPQGDESMGVLSSLMAHGSWEDFFRFIHGAGLLSTPDSPQKVVALQNLLLQVFPEESELVTIGCEILQAVSLLHQPDISDHQREAADVAMHTLSGRAHELNEPGSLGQIFPVQIGVPGLFAFLANALSADHFHPATHANIKATLAHHSGGRGLFVYSGHGGLTAESGAAMVCADTRAGKARHFVGLHGDGLDNVLAAEDFMEGLQGNDAHWTLVLDTCHAGGAGSLQGSSSTSDWTAAGLQARIIAASQSGQQAAEARVGHSILGAMTWALTTTLSRWLPVPDGSGTAIGISHGNLALRANMLLDALSLNQRVTLSAPGPISDAAFLGYDPATRTATDPNEQSGGIEISAGSDEIWIIDFLKAGIGLIARIVVQGATATAGGVTKFYVKSGYTDLGGPYNVNKVLNPAQMPPNTGLSLVGTEAGFGVSAPGTGQGPVPNNNGLALIWLKEPGTGAIVGFKALAEQGSSHILPIPCAALPTGLYGVTPFQVHTESKFMF